MSRQLVSHSADLQRLEEEGYALSFRGSHLLVEVPYVTAHREVATGHLVSELTLSGNSTAAPGNHVAFFIGAPPSEVPCDHHGQPLSDLVHQVGPIDLGGGLVATCSFSHKPNPTYADYYEKMSTYSAMLVGEAQMVDSTATANTFPAIATDEDESVFRYLDSATARARIGAVSDKLRLGKIVIVGTGGSGSYILDLVSKTLVQEIHLYDSDLMLTHNAFRAPGAATLEELNAAPKKVDYLRAKYDAMHRNVVAHPDDVDATNIEDLRDAAFVFVSMDASPAKKFIVQKLQEFGVPFVDTGMGIYQTGDSLGGLVRTTLSAPGRTNHVWEQLSFADEAEDEYDQNIQIAELNMLAAALAVIKWKKFVGFYFDFEQEFSSTYTIDGNHLLNEDQAA